MTPFEQHLQALADLWNQGGKAYLTAQQSMFTGMADTMAKASSVGDKARSRPSRRIRRLRGGAAGLLQAMVVGPTLGRSDQEPARADRENPHVANMLAKSSIPRLVLRHERSRSDASAHGGGAAPRRPVELERKFIAVFNAGWPCAGTASSTTKHAARAAGAFAKMLNERANEGKALESWRAVLTLWVETANEVLLETQRSEAFLTTQRDLIKASSELRLAQQELAAFYSEMFGYPTRTELDDVHRTVTELRRELRAFKRESRAPRTAAESANGAVRKAPRRAAAAQPRRRGAKPAQIGASS